MRCGLVIIFSRRCVDLSQKYRLAQEKWNMRNDKWKMENRFHARPGRNPYHFPFLIFHFSFFICVALSFVAPISTAKVLPTDARASSSRVPSLISTDLRLYANPHGNAELKKLPSVERVTAVGMTVSDMDRSVEFYSKVLSFEKISDVEVAGEEYENLEGVFGVRMRVVRMRLGDEFIELTEYLAPKGRPFPVDSRSNDRWFQHIAIIVSDMDKAYAWLRQNKVEYASSGPQRLPDWNKNAGGISAFYFKDPDGHPVEVLHFPPGKGAARWHERSG